ncbi:MAG: ClbS/DfsB family four-helix bundle protein [Chloroflexi bacterium]|nr:MAG: ClbS/DfsB family four-helix bundle protein [Chloroflexota bacterium]
MDREIQQLRLDLLLAYTKFCKVANQLSPLLRSETGVCGDWSPKEVVAHLVGWDALFQDFIVDPENFDPPIDVNQFNSQAVATLKQLTWAELMHELEDSFRGLEQALSTVQPDLKIYPRVMMWCQGRIEDYELHTGQLAAWLA